MKPLDTVTVILVTFNSRHILAACLSRLTLMQHVIIVDNASDDGTPEAAAQLLPQARVIVNQKNIGFGRANNIALEQTTTPFALLLNPDCVLDDGAIEALLAGAQRYPGAAILAPKIYLAPGKIENSFGPFFYKQKTKKPATDPSGDLCTEWLLGAALFLKMEHMLKIGFFDPWFFLFYEEEDLCIRVRRAGYSSIVINDAHATHVVGRSTRPSVRLSYRRTYCLTLSRLYVTRKYWGAPRMTAKWLSVFFGSMAMLPLNLLWFNKRRILRGLARIAAAMASPRELSARHCQAP